MHNRTLIEDLEARALLASAQIAVGPNNVYLNAVHRDSASYIVRVSNSGDKKLVIARTGVKIVGDNRVDFKVVNLPENGLSVPAGGTRYVTVRFTSPSSGTSLESAQLRLISNDPKRPTKNTPLYALPTAGEGGSSEPSLQAILNLYNLPINSGETDASNYLYPTTQPTKTDEVTAETFVKAGTGNVTIAPIAQFTNDATPNVRVGTYTPGVLDSEKYYYAVDGENTGETVNPDVYGTTSFDPGSGTFGLVAQFPHFSNGDSSIRNVYSEQALNKTWDSSSFHHTRVYPFKDQSGNVVANTYLVAVEEYTAAYDQQDLVYLVTNVKPAAASATLSYENLSGYPTNDTLSFNQILNKNEDATNLVRTTNTLRLRNSGSEPLTVTAAVTGDYSVSNGGAFTIAAGGQRDLTVNFTATSGMNQHKGTLTLTTNDPAQKTVGINLLGYWQEYSEQAPSAQHSTPNEPSAQTLVNKVFGFGTAIPDSTAIKSGASIVKATADEVDAEFFTAADTDAAVRVTELATFHSQTYGVRNSDGTPKLDADGNQVQAATNSHMGWYAKGNLDSYKQVLSDKQGTGQMVLPTSSSGTGITTGVFTPGSQVFGLVVDKSNTSGTNTTSSSGEYSDYSLNPYRGPDSPAPSSFQGALLRFFIARDADGKVIPNTYIMLHDYDTAAVNFDYNDNTYLIQNIIPVNTVKSPIVASASRTSGGVKLNFAGPIDGPKVDGFDIYRSTSANGVYALLNDDPIDRKATINYTDDTADDDTTYYYKIVTLGENGQQSPAVVVSA